MNENILNKKKSDTALLSKENFREKSDQSSRQSCPTLRPRDPQHARTPCPSPTPGVHSDSCPSSQWCHPEEME